MHQGSGDRLRDSEEHNPEHDPLSRPMRERTQMNDLQKPHEPTDRPLVEEFEQEDLVVALPYLHLVAAELCDLGVWPESPAPDQVEENQTLGLALLRNFPGLSDVVPKIREGRALQIRAAEESAPQRTFTDLDLLLLELRTVLAERFGGWVPEMGKNRHVGRAVSVLGGAMNLLGGDGGCIGSQCPMSNALVLGFPEYVHPQDAPPAPTGTAGAGVRIGIVDAPLYPHPNLVGHVRSEDLLAAMLDVQWHGPIWLPWEGHATLVADLMLRQAPAAELDTQAAFSGDSGKATSWEVAKAMVDYADAGVDILNLSIGGRTADGLAPFVLTRAVQRIGRDVLIVAAAGNHGKTEQRHTPVWPAALPDVVAVGASREPGSEFSPNLPWVTCTAPGVNMVGAYLHQPVTMPTRLPPRLAREDMDARMLPAGRIAPQDTTGEPTRFDGYARWSGTSFAAATVSGAVAAAKRPGQTAVEALHDLLERPGRVVRKFEYPPC
jgi:membrane-anchored mycosin MYCP